MEPPKLSVRLCVGPESTVAAAAAFRLTGGLGLGERKRGALTPGANLKPNNRTNG